MARWASTTPQCRIQPGAVKCSDGYGSPHIRTDGVVCVHITKPPGHTATLKCRSCTERHPHLKFVTSYASMRTSLLVGQYKKHCGFHKRTPSLVTRPRPKVIVKNPSSEVRRSVELAHGRFRSPSKYGWSWATPRRGYARPHRRRGRRTCCR